MSDYSQIIPIANNFNPYFGYIAAAIINAIKCENIHLSTGIYSCTFNSNGSFFSIISNACKKTL